MDAESYEKVAVRIAVSDRVCSGSKAQSLKQMLLCFLQSSTAELASWISSTPAPNTFVLVSFTWLCIFSPFLSREPIGKWFVEVFDLNLDLCLFIAAIFRSLLYEACGRIVNPIYGSVGLLWSGSWQLCQAAVEAVLKGAPITPITSEAATSGRGPPLKAYDIRHVSKDENSAASNDPQRVKTRSRFKRSAVVKPKANKAGTGLGSVEPAPPRDANAKATPSPSTINAWTGCCATPDEVLHRSASHESSLSHQSEALNESKESESMISVETAETSVLFRDEPESTGKARGGAEDGRADVALELTLGFEPASRANHVVPVKKRRIEFKDSETGSSCKMDLGLEYTAWMAPVLFILFIFL